ncbi:hypothetical protein CC2G_013640 [Coprinopsis cinerea AmutBmut pab1-1]|nr:hypothetical protein CC2G_013640 [Coprinopsis cinerea AmutBmut pab1-1]
MRIHCSPKVIRPLEVPVTSGEGSSSDGDGDDGVGGGQWTHDIGIRSFLIFVKRLLIRSRPAPLHISLLFPGTYTPKTALVATAKALRPLITKEANRLTTLDVETLDMRFIRTGTPPSLVTL